MIKWFAPWIHLKPAFLNFSPKRQHTGGTEKTRSPNSFIILTCILPGCNRFFHSYFLPLFKIGIKQASFCSLDHMQATHARAGIALIPLDPELGHESVTKSRFSHLGVGILVGTSTPPWDFEGHLDANHNYGPHTLPNLHSWNCFSTVTSVK